MKAYLLGVLIGLGIFSLVVGPVVVIVSEMHGDGNKTINHPVKEVVLPVVPAKPEDKPDFSAPSVPITSHRTILTHFIGVGRTAREAQENAESIIAEIPPGLVYSRGPATQVNNHWVYIILLKQSIPDEPLSDPGDTPATPKPAF